LELCFKTDPFIATQPRHNSHFLVLVKPHSLHSCAFCTLRRFSVKLCQNVASLSRLIDVTLSQAGRLISRPKREVKG